MKPRDYIYKREIEIRELIDTKKKFEDMRQNLKNSGKIKTTWIFKAKYNSNSSQISKIAKKIDKINVKIKKLSFIHSINIYELLMKINIDF